jgi:periplasmic protein TonB
MSGEEIRTREEFGVLGGCFVEGDPEQRRREKRTKRRALALSVSLQIVALAAVILLPLLSRAERISLAIATPIPPYNPYKSPVERIVGSRHQTPQRSSDFFAPRHISQTIVTRDDRIGSKTTDTPEELDGLTRSGNPDGLLPVIDVRRSTVGPPPPPPAKRIVTRLEQAMLMRRVEPIYPYLAIETRREGKVELQAVVATDGTIQSLQVVSGDVMFVRSALDAVAQWRYKPTILNGQAVEVDTTITVVYTLAH